MDAAENVVLIGGPGTGKSHVATALGIQGVECWRGQDHTLRNFWWLQANLSK
jgi:broad-specificity NMP kinase